jgi:hypothetical protein
MKTMVKCDGMPVEAKITVKRVKSSTKVAEWYWTGAFLFMMLAGCAENVLLTMMGVVLMAHATLHRLKVEKRKER